jgi:hypothetical protein
MHLGILVLAPLTNPMTDQAARRSCASGQFEASKRRLRSKCSSKRHQIAVAPIVPRPRRRASERPEPDAFVIDAKQIRKATDRSVRVRSQSRRTIEQVLRCIVGGISDEGLWVDDEPGVAFRPEDIAGVQVGRQHQLYGFGARQFRKEAQTFAD